MLNAKQTQFVEHAYSMFNKKELTVEQLKKANKKFGCKYAPQWLIKNKDYKLGKSLFKLPVDGEDVSVPTKSTVSVKSEAKVETAKSEAAYVVSSLVGDIVPKKDPIFVPFGNYTDVKSIIKSNRFYPIFITGLSGNGKTMGVIQSCAEAKKELIRVNITIETDEDDLLGGYRLKDGQTVWQNGPVIEAMERGALLLLDEVDLASNKIIMNALQQLDRTIPILSEESLVEWNERKHWTKYWLVDPLDGTKEFIKKKYFQSKDHI